MLKSIESRLADIGKKLAPSLPKDALLKLLKQAAALLTEVEQSPSPSTVSAMEACTQALVLPALLRHKDKDVRLLVATCISEIMRIVAPEAPYEDDVLKDIFHLIVAIFEGLNDVSSPSFSRRVNILETVAKVRSCLVMLDLELDDLVLEMFHVFFNTASKEHPQNVFVAMRNILALVLEESEEISQPLLEAVLTNILKDNKDVSPAAHKLAVAVVERSADKLEPYVQKFLTSVMLEGKRAMSELQEDYHDIIYEIYCCAPQMLLAVIPNLTQELVTDQIDVRLKAVELLGRLFALPGQQVTQEYRQLFSEFLKRFSDKAVEVRLTVVACAKACLEANPLGPDAALILAGLDDRLLDYDDKVRMAVMKAICDLVIMNPKWVPVDMIKRVSDRLRDKKVSVRKDTLQKLAEVYRTYTIKCHEGLLPVDEQFEWIPSKIVRCCYDKDFRPQGIEIVFTDDLFSVELPVEQRAKHWIAMFASFDKNDEKAFRNILIQKQRLQLEMQNYLGMRQKSKEEDTPELQKKIQASFKAIAGSFVDSSKAEENLHKLHQMKDNNIFKLLNVLLTPTSLFAPTLATRDDLLKRIGEKHPQHDFIKTLATKCSFLLFNKEHVKAVLNDVTTNKQSGNKKYVASSLSLLVEFAGFFPVLLEGTEKDLLELFKESDESIKEGVVHVLAKAGGSIRDQISDKESSVDLTLEQLCLEGTRKQAKHAVSAIAAISADSGLKALSVLYGRLVDLLEDKHHLPTILQSLGCIAENAIPVFETREEEVVRFVVRNLLKRESVHKEGWKPDWNSPSEECQLKICGVKSLVKSFLPHKDAQLRASKLKGLLGVVAKLLTSGEVSDDIKSSDIDKANLRLAAGKAVLRLARRWDQQILPNIVHSTLLLAHDPSIEVRQRFLGKVHQYLKERALHQKYASVFALVAMDPSKDIVTEGKRYLADFVDTSRREARSKQVSLAGQIEGTTITLHPEYVLTYLVHVLAHQPQFPSDEGADASAYEPIYRQLLAYLRALVHQDGDGRSDLGKKEDVDNLPAILAIFRTIKNAEDLLDKERSEKLYTVCDIGIMITKELGKKKHFSGEYPGNIPLPAAFYKPIELAEGEEAAPDKVDGSHLPSCLAGNDILTQFRTIGGSTRGGQPSSPRGNKRDRRTLDGDSSSDEGEKDEEGDPQSKKSKLNEGPDGTGAEDDNNELENSTVPASKQARGRKKANGDGQKNGIVKATNKTKKDEEEPAAKLKRGRGKVAVVKSIASGEASDDSASPAHKQEDSVEKGKESVEKGKGKKQVVEKTPSKKESEGSPKTLNNSSKKSQGQGLKLAAADPIKTDGQDRSKSGSGREKRSAEATRSPIGTPRNPPMKQSVPIAEKTPKNQTDLQEEGLIGCKVRVWWPLDKRFYKGTVTAFDPKKNKHKVLYDDDEVENLVLANEKWEIVDSSKAVKKVELDKPNVATPSNQSGKLKRKATGQTVDNGSQSPEPSDKKRAITKSGKETNAQTLQEVGRGLAQAKSGILTSPTSKSAKNSASILAGPFAFSDDDVNEPASEKGGKQGRGTSGQLAAKGTGSANTRLKRNSEGKHKEMVESEKSREVMGKEKLKDVETEKRAEKSEIGKMKGNLEKGKGSDQSKRKVDTEKPKAKGDGEKPKAKVDIEKSKLKADSDKSKAKVDGEKPNKVEVENARGKAEVEKTNLKENVDKPKGKDGKDKLKHDVEVEKLKDKAEVQKVKDKVEGKLKEKLSEGGVDLPAKGAEGEGEMETEVEAAVDETAKEKVSSEEKSAQLLDASKKDVPESNKESAESNKDIEISQKDDSKKESAELEGDAAEAKKDDDDEPLGTWRSRRRK